jgi:lipopolysaccharide export LptBFGC system permease protein LptF
MAAELPRHIPQQSQSAQNQDTTKKQPTDTATRRRRRMTMTGSSPALAAQDSLANASVPGAVADSIVKSTPPAVITPGPSISSAVGTLDAASSIEASRARMLENRTTMNRYDVEIQKKFALSAACVVFVLIGAPIALRFPRGGVGLVIGVSLGVFAIYYIGLIAGESLADRAFLTPFWAMWAANVILTAVGLVLLVRMGREGATSRGGDLSEFTDGLRSFFAKIGRRGGLPAERRRGVA